MRNQTKFQSTLLSNFSNHDKHRGIARNARVTHIVDRIAGIMSTLLRTIEFDRRRRQAVRDLGHLDARLLRDIGLDPDQIRETAAQMAARNGLAGRRATSIVEQADSSISTQACCHG